MNLEGYLVVGSSNNGATMWTCDFEDYGLVNIVHPQLELQFLQC